MDRVTIEKKVFQMDAWGPLADLLAGLIAKYADELEFEKLPDPDKYLLLRELKEEYEQYSILRNKFLKNYISIEYVIVK